MSPTGRADEAGFTLLETVCVVAVIALLAGLIWPRVGSGGARLNLEQTAMIVASTMKADRYASLRQGREVATIADLRQREFRSGSSRQVVVIPADINIRATLSGSCPSSETQALLRFFPDGRSCGGVFTLARGSEGFEIRINWLTGGITVFSSNAL
jgi:general secretion pathway protein H